MAATQAVISKRASNPKAKFKALYIKYMVNNDEVTKKIIMRKQWVN